MKSKKSNLPKSNQSITAQQVRLIDQNGEMVGVVSLAEALSLAKKVNLDLVEISPAAKPPVCKILDFGKYKYELKKKSQDAKKKQKTISVKEVKFRPNIGQNDFEVKLRNIHKFIAAGDKVKITLWFRGREIVHADVGKALFSRIIESLTEETKIELEPKLEGKQMMMVLAPAKI